MARRNTAIVLGWLRQLNLRRPDPDGRTGRLGDIAAMLADLPLEIFDGTALTAAESRFAAFPKFDDLRLFLEQRARERGPPDIRTLPPIAGLDLSREEELIVDAFLRRREAGFPEGVAFADLRPNMAPHIDADRERAKFVAGLAVLRRYHERAWRYVCRTDIEAASIAVRMGWDADGGPGPALGYDDPEAIRAMIRRIIAPLPDPAAEARWTDQRKAWLDAMRAALTAFAPENLPILDAMTAPAPAPPEPAPAGRYDPWD